MRARAPGKLTGYQKRQLRRRVDRFLTRVYGGRYCVTDSCYCVARYPDGRCENHSHWRWTGDRDGKVVSREWHEDWVTFFFNTDVRAR